MKTIGRPIQLVLDRLENVRRSGNGWSANCPVHDDTRASLSVGEGRDGRALVHCFAGCDNADIVAAIDLQMCDLFPRTQVKVRMKGAKGREPHS